MTRSHPEEEEQEEERGKVRTFFFFSKKVGVGDDGSASQADSPTMDEQEEEQCFLIRNLDTNETWSLEEFLEIEERSVMVRRRSFQKNRKDTQQESFLIRNLDTNESWSLEEFLKIDQFHHAPHFAKRKRSLSANSHHHSHRLKKRQIFSAITLILIGFGGLFLFTSQWHKLGQFLEWISSIGIWGNVLFVLIFLVVGFPFMLGYIPLAVGAGYLYGMVEGELFLFLIAI